MTNPETKCHANKCEAPATMRVYWPGQTTHQCGTHAEHATRIAQAMGFVLTVEARELASSERAPASSPVAAEQRAELAPEKPREPKSDGERAETAEAGKVSIGRKISGVFKKRP